ncbi:MAG: 4Fe-4S cluster-binding domain-containing protein [Oscillospiraceae bacterium]|nr:4Fe-4S cluster-binding domain-containing protein [Oscillospiraceae bacterium]
MTYKTREGGATVTVFVPYDCHNNCPFCINKQEYKNCEGFSADRICESIDRLHAITPCCDFVFTGGEPLARPDVLQQLMDHVPERHRIFINTTLPVQKDVGEAEIFDFLARNRHKITCLNISRHLVRYVEECDDALLARVRDMGVPIRINCVLFEDYPSEKLPAFIERFRALELPIQFRFDYTATTPENLYEKKGDRILADLMELCEYRYLDGCRMRCGYWFDNRGQTVSYHRTLQVSTVKEDGFDILYDVIVKQDGAIHSDWDGTPMDVEAYERVTYEPYDLRVIERAP